MAIKEGMEGASSTGSYAINPKTKLDTGIRGSVVPSTIKIIEQHSISIGTIGHGAFIEDLLGRISALISRIVSGAHF